MGAQREIHVGPKDMAARLDMTVQNLHKLVKQARLADGTAFPSRVVGNRRTYPADRCFRWYVRWKQEEALQRADQKQKPDTAKEAHLRHAIADAEMAELKLAELRGEVVPVEQYRRELHKVLSRVAERLKATPGEFAPRILPPLEMAQATKILRDLVQTTLAELQGALTEEDEPDEAVA